MTNHISREQAEELLNIARKVGLREVMHGVNSQDAMKLLTEFTNLAIDKVIGEPVAYIRILNGEIDWAEDCLGSHPNDVIDCYEDDDNHIYDSIALYALKQVKP